jgi:hopanoid biosynthesis associated protein HpnK
MTRRYLVINGDDFGISETANQAIIEAHQKGCLTSTSLMITGKAAKQAIELASANPSLSVGLHLVLGCGKSALKHRQIPHLVDKAGNFSNQATWASLNYQFNPQVKAELRAEIRAQLEAFRETGLTLSHLDGHLHHHINPTVMDIVLDLAEEFSIPIIRLPYEEIETTLQIEPQGRIKKIIGGTVFRRLRHTTAKQLQIRQMPYMDRVYGLLQTGRISETYLLQLLPLMQGNLVELYTHPDLVGSGQIELAALLSKSVRQKIADAGFSLVNYQEVLKAV